MRLTTQLRHTADTYPALSENLRCITDKAEVIIKKRYSVSRTVREMDGFARDKDVVRLIVDTFRAMPELPSLAMRDYKPYMALIACSPEDFAFCYLSNDLVAVYETEYRTTELLFFCDLLRLSQLRDQPRVRLLLPCAARHTPTYRHAIERD